MSTDTSIRRAAVTVSVLSGFITPFMGSAVNVALPAIAKNFGLDMVEINWVATAYLLAAGMFLLPFGRLADIYGRKRVFVLGMLLYAVTSALAASATGGSFFIMCRGLQGVAGAMVFGTGMAILSSVYGPGERGKVLGLNVAAVYIGLSVGPPVGGLLTQSLGWRVIFWMMVPLSLAVAGIAWRGLQGEFAGARGEKFDAPGMVLYASALLMLLLGFSKLPHTAGLVLAVVGVLCLLLFFHHELRTPTPLLDLRLLLNNRVFLFSNLAALANYGATAAVGFLLSLYLQYIHSLSPRDAGLVLMIQPLVMAALSPFAGRISDRVEARLVASFGMGLSVAGLSMLFFLQASATSLEYVAVCLVVLGTGFALFSSPNTNAVMGSVERRDMGVASATLGTMRLVGQMMSMALTLAVMAALMHGEKTTPAVFPRFMLSLRATFGISAALCLAGVFASLARGSHLKRA
ncbi:MAG: MFS transporter [Holophagae bacterium]|nr:MAG: MFS transporter [Holophagae bacterium]